MIHIQKPVYYRKFRHIRAYSRPIQTHSAILWHIFNPVLQLHIQKSDIYRILAYLGPKIYSELYQGIFSGIFRMMCNSCIFRTLLYSELCDIQNFGIFRTRGIFKILFISAHYIQVYSTIIVTTALTFFFSL